MKEILEQDERPKVKSGTDEAQRYGDVSRWVFEDFKEFHVVVLCCVLLLMSRSFPQTF